MKQEDNKAILRLLGKQETKKLLFLVVKEIEVDLEPETMGTDIQRAEYVEVLVNRIRSELKKELQKETVYAQTMDLETLISNITTGVEPKWINKKQL